MTWEDYCELVRQIVMKYGGSYRDVRSHTDLDPGQMICAVAYGPDWMQSEEHKHDDCGEEAPEKAVSICRDILENGLPVYIQVQQ